jgi:hypothetical protein
VAGHRNRWRIAFFILLVVWLLSVVTSGYFILDQGITQTYARVSYDDTRHSLTIVERLLPAIQGRNQRGAVLELLRDQNQRALIVATDSTVEIEGLVFRFGADGRLRAVSSR